MSQDKTNAKLIAQVDAGKRDSLRSLITGTAFVVPMVATFSVNGLKVNEASAYSGNVTL